MEMSRMQNCVQNYYGENVKMEESEPKNRVVGLLAYHLVNLVLQEGCRIANAAIDSGRPREYLSQRKNVRSDLTYVIPACDNAANVDTTVDNFIEGAETAKVDSELNLLVTSTPQKTDDQLKRENGQGDEDMEVNELSNSTSLFINHLFDISDVELGICDDTAFLQNANSSELLSPLMSNVMDLYVNAALDAFHASRDKEISAVERDIRTPFNSPYSYFEEELINTEKDVTFYVEDDVPRADNVYEIPQDPMTSQMALQQSGDVKEIKVEHSEQYENTYLTLNRDYEQCSDEEEFPVLKDPKGLIMQEIALITADSSNETGPVCDESEEVYENREEPKGDLGATSGVSASSRKSGLVQRWRLQGARFLACIRGWWRRNRKAGGKRKEASREPGSRRGLCPLSPVARRRTASLLDRRLSSPAPSRVKCNTINEALLNSSHWMDYTFEAKPNECGDV